MAKESLPCNSATSALPLSLVMPFLRSRCSPTCVSSSNATPHIVVMEQHGVLVAIAGRRDPVRVYALRNQKGDRVVNVGRSEERKRLSAQGNSDTEFRIDLSFSHFK
jgi:hypothetical protein